MYVWPLYVSTLYVTTLCSLYIWALYVWPLYVNTLCEHSMWEHSICEHPMWDHSICEHSMCEHSMWALYGSTLCEHSMCDHSMLTLYVSTECVTLYVSTLCVTTLCEHSMCDQSMWTLYVWPVYVNTVWEHSLCEHSMCDHSIWAHRKVRKLPGKMNISSWAGCCRTPKSTKITRKHRLQFLGRMLQRQKRQKSPSFIVKAPVKSIGEHRKVRELPRKMNMEEVEEPKKYENLQTKPVLDPFKSTAEHRKVRELPRKMNIEEVEEPETMKIYRQNPFTPVAATRKLWEFTHETNMQARNHENSDEICAQPVRHLDLATPAFYHYRKNPKCYHTVWGKITGIHAGQFLSIMSWGYGNLIMLMGVSLNGGTPKTPQVLIIFSKKTPWLLGKPTILGNPLIGKSDLHRLPWFSMQQNPTRWPSVRNLGSKTTLGPRFLEFWW